MITNSRKIINHTKEKLTQYRYSILKLSCMLAVVLFFTSIFLDNTAGTAGAASGLRIYNYATKKETTYTGKQIMVTYNGTEIGNADTPGILVDGYALLPYTDIFNNSGIDADCVYDKTKGTVSITKYNKTILMTIGSKNATVNGKAVTLPVAPMKIKYVAANKAKVLVPSRYVSETLGLGYTWYSDKNTVAIEKYSIRLSYNNGEIFEYTGAQGNVTIDGKKVNLGNMPSIITNNTAMLRAKRVFADSSIGAKYSYNKADKTVTLKKGDITLTMTIGSNTAYLNGKATRIDTAPILVTNHETNTSYVMVPGTFTAACLGYNYSWNNTTRTSIITAQSIQNTGSETSNNSSGANNANTNAGTNSGNANSGNTNSTSPELGDSGVINETGTILNQWIGNETNLGKSSGIHELNTGSTASASTGYIYYASRDNNDAKPNKETFLIAASAPFNKVTSSQSGKNLTIQAEYMNTTDTTYQMYGITSNYVNTIGTYQNADGKGTTINLEMLPDYYQYDIFLSADQMILYVNVYVNAITAVTVGTNSNGDYLTIEGLNPVDAVVSNQLNMVYIDVSNTANSLGEIITDISGSKYINQIYALSYSGKTQFILSLKEGYEPYIIEDANRFTVVFQALGAGALPDNPTVPEVPNSQGTPNNPSKATIPEVKDKSKYEIVIPKPSDISTSLITDEDVYLQHYFVIRIPGDYTQFYNSNPVTYQSEFVKSISVALNTRGETEIKITTTKLQGYELAQDQGNLYVNIGNPKDIYKNIVVLDPGHGGSANGAQYFDTKEKDLNFYILYTIGKNIFNQDPSKLKVYYTRTTDSNPTLMERAKFAKEVGADLFVSLHMNASISANAYGSEVYYSKQNNSPNKAGLTSEIIAEIMVDNICNAMGTFNRGAKSAAYTVVHNNTVPAVLIELGFLSNKNDFAIISDQLMQETAVYTIYDTLLQMFKAYPTGR